MAAIRNGRRSSAHFSFVAIAAFAFAVPALAASVTVPVNVYVEVELTERLTSATSHVGDTFGFATTRDVTLGTLAIPKGTHGHGRLAVVQPADAKHQGRHRVAIRQHRSGRRRHGLG